MSVHNKQHRNIRKARKESLLFREVASLFQQHTFDEPSLKDVYVTRVELSPELGMCIVYFYSPLGESHFKDQLKQLILYKPSLRRAIANRVELRHVPDFLFKFDTTVEKQERIAKLLAQIKTHDENPADDSSDE